MSKDKKKGAPREKPPAKQNGDIWHLLFEIKMKKVGGFLRGKNLVDRLKPKGTSKIPEGAEVIIKAYTVEEVKD